MDRILVALDASPRAPAVLATAIDLARRTGAKLQLFRAVGLPPEIPASLWSTGDVLGALLDQARGGLEDLARDVPKESLLGTSVEVGTPWDAICTAAKRFDADLIVIGSHGYSGLDKILGTTAAKVVNHCDRSVLVVRMQPEKKK